MRNSKGSTAGQWIWGEHSLEACFQTCPERVLEVVVSDAAEMALRKRLQNLAQDAGLSIKTQKKLPSFLEEKRTQGCAARLKNFPLLSFEDHEKELTAAWREARGQWVVLDALQDPRNFGAVLRSAAAFGVRGVFVGRKDQSPLTGVVAQASAGQMFRVPIYQVASLRKIAERAREAGVEILALESSGEDVGRVFGGRSAEKSASMRAWMWLLGSEGSGLQPGLEKLATRPVAIPMQSEVESLNASVAAGLAFFMGYLSLRD